MPNNKELCESTYHTNLAVGHGACPSDRGWPNEIRGSVMSGLLVAGCRPALRWLASS